MNFKAAWPVLAFAFSQMVTAGGVYGAIRADLRESQVRVSLLEKRLDRIEDRKP
jgi:hypothetical protein